MPTYEGTRVLLRDGHQKDYPEMSWRPTERADAYQILKTDGSLKWTYSAGAVESIEDGTFVLPLWKWVLIGPRSEFFGMVALWVVFGAITLLLFQVSADSGQSQSDGNFGRAVAWMAGMFWSLATMGVVFQVVAWATESKRKSTPIGH